MKVQIETPPIGSLHSSLDLFFFVLAQLPFLEGMAESVTRMTCQEFQFLMAQTGSKHYQWFEKGMREENGWELRGEVRTYKIVGTHSVAQL